MAFSITKEVLDGHPVLIMTGGGQQMRIAPDQGANWFRWTVDGMELFAPHCLDWPGTKYGVPVLFPTPNRVVNAQYRWKDKTYTQKKNGEPRIIHGLVYDEPFAVTEIQQHESYCAVDLELTITDGELLASFPFPCRLKLTYRLDETGPMLTYQVVNLGEETLPFGFAIHPYFAKMDPPEDTCIRVPAPYVHEADADKFPSGLVQSVEGTYYDLREFRSTADAVLDHVYWGMEEGMQAELEWRRSGRAVILSASADFDHMVVFTPTDRPCICLENQTCSTDAHNRHAAGYADTAHLLMLEKGESHEGWIRFETRRLSL